MREADPALPVWVDGEEREAAAAVLPVVDPAVQHARGLFETIAVREGRCLDLARHVERLTRGITRVGGAAPDERRIVETIAAAAARGAWGAGWVKLLWTASGRWFVFGGAMDPAEEGRAVRVGVLPWRREPGPHAGLKTCNHADHAAGLRWARERGFDEGLWRNAKGHVVEGCWSNVFVRRRDALFTPHERTGLLPGVVRARVLEAANDAGLRVHVGPLRVKRMLAADEVFVTSSLRGICSVAAVDGRPVGRGGASAAARMARALGRLHRGLADATF